MSAMESAVPINAEDNRRERERAAILLTASTEFLKRLVKAGYLDADQDPGPEERLALLPAVQEEVLSKQKIHLDEIAVQEAWQRAIASFRIAKEDDPLKGLLSTHEWEDSNG